MNALHDEGAEGVRVRYRALLGSCFPRSTSNAYTVPGQAFTALVVAGRARHYLAAAVNAMLSHGLAMESPKEVHEAGS